MIDDLRGKLPVSTTGEQYVSRPLDAIYGVTLHYTAGPADQSVEAIAEYQTSPAAASQTGTGSPFPAIAYTLVVTGDGVPHLCHDLETRTWHSAASPNGVSRNLTHVGICYTGSWEPNRDQIRGLAEAIHWVKTTLGRRTIEYEGHKDAPYPTACPGPAWPSWSRDLELAIADLVRSATYYVGPGIQSFLDAHPEYGKPRHAERSMEPESLGRVGAYVWTTPTKEHPKGGLVVWRDWLNEARFLAWE